VVGLLQVIIAFVFTLLLSLIELAVGRKDEAQSCGSSFLSQFGERSLSSQFDAIDIMSFIRFKRSFERVDVSFCQFKLMG